MKTTNHSFPKSKKTWVIFLCLFTFSLTVIPQNQQRQERGERIENLKIAFLSRKMGLTTSESQKFWPIYNEYETDLAKLEKARGSWSDMDEKKLGAMTDSEIEESLKSFIKNGQEILDLRKKFHTEMKEVLPVRKVALYYIAERDFKKELVRMAIEQRQKSRRR